VAEKTVDPFQAAIKAEANLSYARPFSRTSITMNDGSSDRDDIRNAIISPLFLAIMNF
jgi:hypothetical protein